MPPASAFSIRAAVTVAAFFCAVPETASRPPNSLSPVTIAECHRETRLHTVGVPRLRSLRYSGKFFDFSYDLPMGPAPTGLYICLSELIPHTWNRILPNDLSGLTVLTVCSNALKVCS